MSLEKNQLYKTKEGMFFIDGEDVYFSASDSPNGLFEKCDEAKAQELANSKDAEVIFDGYNVFAHGLVRH